MNSCRKIRKSGNTSFMVTIPKEVVKFLELTHDDSIKYVIENNKVVIKKA